jgi:CRP-like cAMP-binding protein
MENDHPILVNISKHILLDDHEKEYFLSLLKQRQVKRKDFLLQAGQPCETFNYVIDGALRAFYKDDFEKEVTIMFAVGDWWITDMPCFVNRQPAMISIEAIEDTAIMELSFDDLEMLYIKVPKFERLMRILMQNAYIREQIRILQTFSLTAEERYEKFIAKYPRIASQVTNKNIASYLGITPEFLSVIRNKIRKTKSS